MVLIPPEGSALWRRFAGVVRRQPDALALVQGDHATSFAMLDQQALDAARRMAAIGVARGDRCLFLAANTPALAAHILGAWRLGAIIVLLNEDAPPTHIAHAVHITSPALIVAGETYREAASHIAQCPLLSLDAAIPQASASPAPLPIFVQDDDAPASILFTSGSTGLPKGVVQSHATLLAGCDMVARHLGYRPSDRILCPIPWSFDYGFGQLLTTVLAGITQILPEARDPFRICAAIARHRPSVFAGLPSLFALLLRGVSPLRETVLTSIRLATSTGGKIPPAILADMRDIFSQADISLNYGMTETYRSAGLPCDMIDRADSVGFAYPGVDIRILRDDGSEAAAGEIGEIVHRGIGVFLGYWQAPEATAKVLRPDPFGEHGAKAVFTGDLGWKDEQGLLHIQGRRDRMIKSMGVRISPDEIEALIRASRLVQDVAVLGMPHEMMGEMPVAAIVAADGDPVPALKQYARGAMSPAMQPRAFHRLDALPLTPNGKVDFPALRLLFAGGSR